MNISLEGITEAEMQRYLEWLFVFFWKKFCRAQTIRFDVIELDSGRIIHLKGNDMSYILPDDKKVTLSIQPVDARGNPAKVEGVPEWSSSDANLLTVTPAADGMSAVAQPVGPLGTVQVSVSADADLGPGVATITGLLDVEIQAGQAVSLAISAGAQEPV